jgi:transcription initiation factor TFIID TATA-box-binding protein
MQVIVTHQKIQNIVSVGHLSHPVRIADMSRDFKLDTQYEPELFPGLRMNIIEPRMKALVFLRGRVVLTGAKNRDDIIRAWAVIEAAINPYLRTSEQDNETSVRHCDITQTVAAIKRQ